MSDFLYDLLVAAEVTWDNVGSIIRDKFCFEEIYRILEIEGDILMELGIYTWEDDPVTVEPVELDWEALKYEIIFRAVGDDIFLDFDELQAILDGELVYFDQNGVLSYDDK